MEEAGLSALLKVDRSWTGSNGKSRDVGLVAPSDSFQECVPLRCLAERNCLKRPWLPRESSLPMELLREH